VNLKEKIYPYVNSGTQRCPNKITFLTEDFIHLPIVSKSRGTVYLDLTMCCRGAKQISYNYNYGQFSTFVSGDAASLLQHPQLVSTTWLALASAVWFFVMPQPPKPSMLDVSVSTVAC
jgi:hypothetical protein